MRNKNKIKSQNFEITIVKFSIISGKVLGNIAMRGVMFAVCVSPENEVHR